MKSGKLNIGPYFRKYIHKLLLLLIFSSIVQELSSGYCESGCSFITQRDPDSKTTKVGQQKEPELRKLNTRILKLKTSGDTASKRLIVDSLKTFISEGIKADSSDLADSYYLIGTYYLTNYNNTYSLFYLKKASEIYEKSNMRTNSNYSNSLYNIGLSYYNLGDFSKAINSITASIENDELQYGKYSPHLIYGYFALSGNNIKIRDNEKAIMWINKGLKIAQLFPDSVSLALLAALYQIKGVAFLSMANYEEAKNNLEKAETYYDKITNRDINYISLLDNLGTAYHFLGSKEKSYYFYEKGMKLLKNDLSQNAFNIINNYAIILGNDYFEKKGEALLSDFLKKLRLAKGTEQRNYYTVLRNYADYLREYKINKNQAKETYLQCFNYLNDHPWDKEYRDNVILGYSSYLFQNGENLKALDSLQTLLHPIRSDQIGDKRFPNPDSIKPDVRSLSILRTKYQILWSEYKKTNDLIILESAAGTSELIIAVLEKIRLGIGEEGSRLILGDKYRNSYEDAISCLNECYNKTNKQFYLEKAFEFSEKSKVASLLASTREMKAILNHIPSDLANQEKGLEVNIGFYSSILSDEENKEKPDARKLSLWKDYLLEAKDRRDSLIMVFEKNYPDYYALKYNTKVVSSDAIPGLIGRTNNYLSYILTDSLLYTLVLNSRYQQLIAQRIDTSFIALVKGFRKLLITPDLDEKAADEFNKFQVYGYKLYSFLIEPIKKYLISDNLIISPDNILSYLPFEDFLTEDQIRDDLVYGKLPYLMNDYRITYEYSATLLAENGKAKPSLQNPGIVFAPTYNAPIYIDSISSERQSIGRILGALPYALEEAEYVSNITHGKLYSGTTATESLYKQLAGKFDIVHLAMHTYINNQNPVYSKLIFSVVKDSLYNNGLNAFEIYGIPLKSKMVVLSSCNTGAGNLRNGEGVLSLARGFIYSGSKSVVMSLWEVDDKSGTDIVKYFYKNLKNGDSKSEALRKARIKYLKSAGTVRSFPFFWSTLVVYGDDSPIYYSLKVKLLVVFISLLLLSGGIFYFKKR
jgi:CHAT domain-containing protein/tetratricopeptide (TPR) repeat protein